LLKIRRADEHDAVLLAEIGKRTFFETFAGSNRFEDMDDYLKSAFSIDRIAGELRQRSSAFFIADDPTKPVGFAKLEFAHPPDCVTGPSPIRLHKLYVSADVLGTGVGAALMRFGIDWAMGAGYETMWLGVWEHNHRALAFYKKWGFRPVGTETFRLGSDDQVDLLMERSLADVELEAISEQATDVYLTAASPRRGGALQILRTHHVAIICSDYEKSKAFYTQTLGLEIISEVHRTERNSCKLDLRLPDGSQIELFSFPDPPRRPSYPESCGLRHLAFEVANIIEAILELQHQGITVEDIRTDEYTGKRFTFFADPDGLPLELYER
jgi:catechol 2,3-dioxygenase-like lactoylglutathione lyase family enzyme/GNAT superfamily N-acetyltransferase